MTWTWISFSCLNYFFCYHAPMKLLEGNASNRVCLSVHRGEVCACATTNQSRVTRGFFYHLAKPLMLILLTNYSKNETRTSTVQKFVAQMVEISVSFWQTKKLVGKHTWQKKNWKILLWKIYFRFIWHSVADQYILTNVIKSSNWVPKEKYTSGCIFALYVYVMVSLTVEALHLDLLNSSR